MLSILEESAECAAARKEGGLRGRLIDVVREDMQVVGVKAEDRKS